MLEFDWDYENVAHIAMHNVSPDEAEFALLHRTVQVEYQDSHETEERFAEVGMTGNGRILYILTTIRRSMIRVVTAYDAPRHLVKEYLERG